jgi:hypothetical protein
MAAVQPEPWLRALITNNNNVYGITKHRHIPENLNFLRLRCEKPKAFVFLCTFNRLVFLMDADYIFSEVGSKFERKTMKPECTGF